MSRFDRCGGLVRPTLQLNVHSHRVRPRPAVGAAPGTTGIYLPRAGLNEFGEEDLDLSLGRLRGVAAVHDVLRDLQGVVAADGAGRGLHRVGGAGQRAERLDGPLALGDDRDQRAGGDEIDQFAEEGPFRVLGIVRVRGVPVDCSQFKRDHFQALALNSGNYVPDDAALYAVRLDEDKGALCHYGSLRLLLRVLIYWVRPELTGAGTGPGPTAGQAALGVSRSHLRPSQMPVNQSAAKIARRMYIAGTSTPQAMTSTWNTDPAYSAPLPRPTYPHSASATIAMAPQTAPARPALTWPSVFAGTIASRTTTASMDKTVTSRRFTRSLLAQMTPAVPTEPRGPAAGPRSPRSRWCQPRWPGRAATGRPRRSRRSRLPGRRRGRGPPRRPRRRFPPPPRRLAPPPPRSRRPGGA